jgi:hypothetical protein
MWEEAGRAPFCRDGWQWDSGLTGRPSTVLLLEKLQGNYTLPIYGQDPLLVSRYEMELDLLCLLLLQQQTGTYSWWAFIVCILVIGLVMCFLFYT